MKAIVSVLGHDRPGIVATVSTALYEAGANILDLSQTVMGDQIFAMTMWVDLSAASVSFADLKGSLDKAADELGMEIRIQREEIFDSMYRI